MEKLKTLNELVSIKSDINSDEILKYIESKLKDNVKEIIYVENEEDNKNNMLIGVNTKLKDIEPVVLSGHIDTVGADLEKYKTNPYSLVIQEDKAYGLGVIDMKCFTSSVIDLIENLKKLSYPVVIVITGDEETNLFGITNVIKKLKQLNIKPKFTIIGEPTSLQIKNISNGCFEYKVEVYGKSCHSSTPQNGINSICIISRIVIYIEELSEKYDDLTMSCDLIEGGTIINRVPDYASMSFDIRTVSMDNYKEVINCIETEIKRLENEYLCKIKFSNKLKIPPLTFKNEGNINKLSRILNLKMSKFNGGCEAGYYEEYSGDAILFGVGDLSLAHKPNEYMVIEDYFKYNGLLLDMLKKLENIYFDKVFQ